MPILGIWSPGANGEGYRYSRVYLRRADPRLARMKKSMRIDFAKEFDQCCNATGPTRLMASAEAGSVVPMEIFVEQQVISPFWIILKFLSATEDRAPAVIVTQKNSA
jgi:hypothetical protein